MDPFTLTLILLMVATTAAGIWHASQKRRGL